MNAPFLPDPSEVEVAHVDREPIGKPMRHFDVQAVRQQPVKLAY